MAMNKILFPVDFSDRCAGAARYLEVLAGRSQAEIMLLHVVDTGTHWYPADAQPVLQKRLDEFLVGELQYFTTHRVCEIGDPAHKIAEKARGWKPDLIMMPTHGVGPYRRFLLGSVAAKVLHDVDCPVWTGVHSEQAPPLEDIHIRKVLCAIDLGLRSRAVLDWAASLATEYGASLGIVHAIPSIEPPPGVTPKDLMVPLTRQADAQIRDLQAEAGTRAPVPVMSGEPSKIVACGAKNFEADLLVIGRHSGGVLNFLRHNAYAILRESPCPVISI